MTPRFGDTSEIYVLSEASLLSFVDSFPHTLTVTLMLAKITGASRASSAPILPFKLSLVLNQ